MQPQIRKAHLKNEQPYICYHIFQKFLSLQSKKIFSNKDVSFNNMLT